MKSRKQICTTPEALFSAASSFLDLMPIARRHFALSALLRPIFCFPLSLSLSLSLSLFLSLLLFIFLCQTASRIDSATTSSGQINGRAVGGDPRSAVVSISVFHRRELTGKGNARLPASPSPPGTKLFLSLDRVLFTTGNEIPKIAFPSARGSRDSSGRAELDCQLAKRGKARG